MTATLLLGGCATSGEPTHDRSVAAVVVDATGLTQTLVPRGSNFSVLEVRTATHGAPGPSQGTLELLVTDGTEARRASAGAADVGDNTTVRFRFEPFPESAGRSFTATVWWTGDTDLALWTNPNDTYADGELSPGPGDLVFTVGHAGRLRGGVEAIGRIVDEATDNLADEPVVASGWLLGLAALGVVAVRRPRAGGGQRTDRDRGDDEA